MANKKGGAPPRWLFTVLMVLGFISGGLYLGMMRVEGLSTGSLVRAVGYGALGFIMLWGVLARR